MAGPPVLFIHDVFDDPASAWTAGRDFFAGGLPATQMDLAGHGASGRKDEPADGQMPMEINLTRLGGLLAAFAEPAALVAHGFSARLALRAAALYPDQVGALVLIGPRLHLKPGALARLAARFPRPFLFFYLLLHDPLAESIAFWRRPFVRLRTLRTSWAAAYLDQLLHQTDPPHVAGVRAPVLLLSGDGDPFDSSTDAEGLNLTLVASQLIRYAGLGRSPHKEAPELVYPAIWQFIETATRKRGLGALGAWLKNLLRKT